MKIIVLTAAICLIFLSGLSSAEAPQPVNPAIRSAGGPNSISLDIKGMDVVDVIKMLASRAGMNVVVGKNVTGRVTLFLKNVDVQDAFEIILLANDLAYEKKGDIVNIMTQKDYELSYGERYQDKKQARVIRLKYAKAADLSKALTQMKTNIGKIVVDEGSNTVVIIDSPATVEQMENFIQAADIPLETKVFNLNYGMADKLQPKLQEAITKNVGSLRIDERTNKILVTDYPAKIEEISKMIAAFDDKTPQVLIDAQILDISPSDKFEMGVDWDFFIKKYFEMQAHLPINTDNALILGTHSQEDPTQVGKYRAAVDILRTIGDTKVLSSPRIMALNNQEAKIHVGIKDAYITSTTSQAGTGTAITSQSVNFVDTGIQLSVTPTINRDGFVTMKIKPEISDSTRTNITSQGQITQIPIVTTSEAETTVMVKDGVTIIIGGLRKDKVEKTVKKIPILGDIPFLGMAFRSTSDSKTKDELVILLTPHIISGESSYTSFSEIPPEQGAIARMEKGEIIVDKIKPQVRNIQEPKDIKTVQDYKKFINARINGIIDSIVGDNIPKGSTRLSFTLDAQGRIKEGPWIIASAKTALDDVALKSVRKASPFPSFPESLNKPEEVFTITISSE